MSGQSGVWRIGKKNMGNEVRRGVVPVAEYPVPGFGTVRASQQQYRCTYI